MTRIARSLVIAAVLLLFWEVTVRLTDAPSFILPGPDQVALALYERWRFLIGHAGITLIEILLGLGIGTVLGGFAALLLASARTLRLWLLPLLVVSQAIPVFALAPILVLWLGYGLASKVAMASLIIFFPVTAATFDGLRRTDPGWLDLAATMGAGRWSRLRHIRIPAALPAFASGLRVATAVAPIGAVVGEWVGSSAGLGYAMLQANARGQVAVMFAALFILTIIAVTLYSLVDIAMRRILPWQPDSLDASRKTV
ncbi:ABC transporter permease [Limibacillus sp. MBR-115]|jgi:putative hydroxymethylpyrimidine transport system permease protein|uniref:ABC transporter permease n=1 Tax=Limibacillus sp. MBR-115 TaxID=3156465 RepID=UPI003395C94D